MNLSINKKITVGIWSIKIFQSKEIISYPPHHNTLKKPTIIASDVKDVPAEFIADPFIIAHQSEYYLFFEVLDKSTGKGIIGLAKSSNGEDWKYEKVVLKENFHLSYPYVFKYNDEIFMIPETCEAGKIILYKATEFPYKWKKETELIKGKYVDSSIFRYKNKWWLFAAKSGKLHLFHSDKLYSGWQEHRKSPLISDNRNITRPGGRVIVNGENMYRYTQDGEPTYGSSVRVFKITQLSDQVYEENEVNLILRGTGNNQDWRKDGMHTIDQLKIADDKWLIAVDGHKLETRNLLIWKLENIFFKGVNKFKSYKNILKRE